MSDEERQAFNEALASAQAEFPIVPKGRTVTVQKKAGGTYSYTYAPLDSILEAVRPVLASHGFALIQLLEDDGRGPALRTELRHKAGGQVSGTFPLREAEDMQGLGSNLTYLRRYAITAILGLATETDDDGHGQAGETKTAPKPKPKPKPKGPDFPIPSAPPDPDPEPGPELAPLVTEVTAKLERLRKLEAELEIPARRDWTRWVRVELGLAPDAIPGAEDYRRASELLAREESRLVAALARKTERGG